MDTITLQLLENLSSPKSRRGKFKARHKCGTAKSKLTARYWSCKKLWAGKGGSTKSSPKSRRGKY